MDNILWILFQALVFPGALFLILLAFFYDWFDRKIVARMQNRVGPLVAGRIGILQPFYDFVKLVAKEDITPAAAVRPLFTTMPVMAVAIAVFSILFVPMLSHEALLHFEGDMVLVMTLNTFFSIIVFMAGWAAMGRFGSVGAERAATQLMGYEIPEFISAFSVCLLAGSLSITAVNNAQAQVGIPFILLQPLGFVVFLVSLQAELEKVPFDIPEAKTEIVGGWLAEYSGKKLAFFKLAEELRVVFGAALMATLFFGGNHGPLLPPIAWFLIKTTIAVFIISTFRAVAARFRIDQVLKGGWKWLTPLALLQVLITYLVFLVVG